MKTFDVEQFNKNKINNRYTYISKDSTKVEQSTWQFGYEETITKQNDFFQVYNKYYKDGTLKVTGEFFPDDFLKGVWKEYDEQGNLVKETDYDAPYKFTWEDVLKLIKERKIDMSHEQFRVIRGSSEKGTSWAIVYDKPKTHDRLGVINIDGITGKITREAEIDYPADGDYDDE
ncbi:hypothetical protein HN014_19930 [Aquimarina sp. TRL1]|uniref:hypothetical protein n=1 Tax=Aquimarina sp. (strain TRL1) TaxID=2736252 RepID=UPI00158F471F|nr:hypothetical protein [Aquimarina sp. TRL1]QKX07087.1 hypothetical protein HN014_19930 [Aquimarina sp. TRL1]